MPAGAIVHAGRPALDAYQPGEQGVQLIEPATEKVPAGGVCVRFDNSTANGPDSHLDIV